MSFRLAFLVISFLPLAACAQSTANYDTLIQEGNKQLQAGNLTDALANGNRAIALDHGRWQAYALAGGALMNLKRYEEAADSFSKAIERAPNDKQAALRDLRKQCALAEADASTPLSGSAAAPSPASAPSTTQAEVVLWKSIENSRSQSDFQEYLSQYPSGAFAGLAHSHLDQLQAEDRALQEQRSAQWVATRQQAEEQFKAGVQFEGIAYPGKLSWSDQSKRTGSIIVSPQGIAVTATGKSPGPMFSATCSDFHWNWNNQNDWWLRVTVISTKKVYSLDILTSPHIQPLVDALNLYCPGRRDR